MSEQDINHLSVLSPQNKYGYRIDISHPCIKPLYEKFKSDKKTTILSDDERHEFETIILTMISNQPNKKEETNAEHNIEHHRK